MLYDGDSKNISNKNSTTNKWKWYSTCFKWKISYYCWLVFSKSISSIIENDTIINKEELIKKFDNGIKIPQGNLLNHGDYISNFANELNFCMKEDSLNILALAHELYLLEVITRIS